MGWMFCKLPAGQTVERFALAEEFGGSHRVLAHAMVGDVIYTAVQTTRGDSPIVYGCVTLTERRGGEIGLKTMDETQGPNASAAPARILDLLTPLDKWPEDSTGFAADWRARCRENLKGARRTA